MHLQSAKTQYPGNFRSSHRFSGLQSRAGLQPFRLSPEKKFRLAGSAFYCIIYEMNSRLIRLALSALITTLFITGLLAGDDGTQIVARGMGFSLQQAEVEKAAESKLKHLELEKLRAPARIRKQRHLILAEAMQELAAEKMLSLEAAARGITVAELIEQEVSAEVKPLSREELGKLYEINRTRLQGTREEVEKQITDFVTRQRMESSRKGFVEELAMKYGVKYDLPPVRFDIETAGHPSFGPDDAPVTIIEFSDFECPHCAKAPAELHKVYEEFAGKVRIVFRQYPLWMIHPHAHKAAEAALCAAKQGKFWEMHNLLFSGQDGLDNAGLKEKASTLGLDRDEFDKCLDSGSCRDAVELDLIQGSEAGISSTPSIFINGRPLPAESRISYQTIRNLVIEELEKAGSR